MARVVVLGTVFAVAGFVLVSMQNASAQRRYYGGSRSFVNTQQFVRRIESLERRVIALEHQVGRRRPADAPQPVTVTVEEAEQRLKSTKMRLKYAEELHSKGYISEAELEADRFAYHRAEKTLHVAQAEENGEPVGQLKRDIEIQDAEQRLAIVERQLQLAKNIKSRGFLGQPSLDVHRQAVEEAKANLESVRQKPLDEPKPRQQSEKDQDG